MSIARKTNEVPHNYMGSLHLMALHLFNIRFQFISVLPCSVSFWSNRSTVVKRIHSCLCGFCDEEPCLEMLSGLQGKARASSHDNGDKEKVAMVMPVAWIAAPEQGWAIAEGFRKPGGRHDGIK